MAETTERPLDQISDADLFRATQEPESPQGELPLEGGQVTAPPVSEPPATPPPVAERPEVGVPSWRLREEAEARRLAEDRARQLEARLGQIVTHLQQQQKPPEFFQNPEQATQALIAQSLQPYAAALQQQAEENRRHLMYMGKMVASQAHGADKVEAAEQAFLAARENQTLDPADYERVVQSPNRYDAVVQWHKRQTVWSAVGDDPNAWFEKQLEARMADPAFQASMLEKVQKGAASRPSMTRLPPSLSKMTAAASNGSDELGDMSDKSLFAFATKR